MTALRQRMIEDMQLQGLASRRQTSYMRAVRQLSEHYHKYPDQISEEELRQYFLYLKNIKKVARSTCTLALCAIKFFYERTLQREWATLALVRPQREKKLPVVLSVDEVRQILARVRRWRYRVCLSTIYAVGCVCRKDCTCRSAISTERASWCMCVTAKGAKTAMCRCPNRSWRCCGGIGVPTAIQSGSFHRHIKT